jgi:hypothetical protein
MRAVVADMGHAIIRGYQLCMGRDRVEGLERRLVARMVLSHAVPTGVAATIQAEWRSFKGRVGC